MQPLLLCSSASLRSSDAVSKKKLYRTCRPGFIHQRPSSYPGRRYPGEASAVYSPRLHPRPGFVQPLPPRRRVSVSGTTFEPERETEGGVRRGSTGMDES